MLYEFLKDYFPIILFLIIAFGLSCVFIILNYLLSPKNPDPEKLSAYECGFEPFNDSRMEFDVRFYLVAILFIIFDLEIAFLFPAFLHLTLRNIICLFFFNNTSASSNIPTIVIMLHGHPLLDTVDLYLLAGAKKL